MQKALTTAAVAVAFVGGLLLGPALFGTATAGEHDQAVGSMHEACAEMHEEHKPDYEAMTGDMADMREGCIAMMEDMDHEDMHQMCEGMMHGGMMGGGMICSGMQGNGMTVGMVNGMMNGEMMDGMGRGMMQGMQNMMRDMMGR
jgi:hypothetical protein